MLAELLQRHETNDSCDGRGPKGGQAAIVCTCRRCLRAACRSTWTPSSAKRAISLVRGAS